MKKRYGLYILLLLILSSCGSSRHTSVDTGSISFSLELSHPAPISHVAAAIPSGICTDYGITTINANVVNSSGTTVVAANWLCSNYTETITDVPSGNDYTIRFTGIVSGGAVAWRGEKGGISVSSGETTSAGVITMLYTGNDITPPSVTSSTPSIDADGVPVTNSITAVFSEKMAASTINDSTFTLKNS